MDDVIGDYAPEPLIDADRVIEILRDVMFKDDELPAEEILRVEDMPENAVHVDGILHPWGFHRERLESHRVEISKMLQGLPIEFRDQAHGGGGGWSFLNACQDANDVQWTGLHQTMDVLICLGIGLGLAEWLLPRDMWEALPGGMPYFVVKT
jgi:hypothetical protein